MRVAIAVFEDQISPRFCCAREVEVLDWDGARVTHMLPVELGTTPYPARLEILAKLQVAVLMCGAFPCAQKPCADRLGVAVVCGLSGSSAVARARLGELLAGVTRPCDPE